MTEEHPKRRASDQEGYEVVVDKVKEPWHLSRSVPITLLLALFIQTIVVAGAWFTHKSDFENFKIHTQTTLELMRDSLDDRYRKSEAMAQLALRDERISNNTERFREVQVALSELNRSMHSEFKHLHEKLDVGE